MGVTATTMAAAAKVKLASLILAGTLAATGVGAAGATVAASNGAFGQSVRQQVVTCKAALKTGEHGIGQCVSTFAKDHGQDKREQHSHGNGATSGSHGQSGESHGKSGESHGKSGESHGKSGESHGKSGESHGQSGNAGAASSHP